MTSLTISAKSKAVNELLRKAKRKNLVLVSADGERYVLCRISKPVTFYIGDDDDFTKEIVKTRKNKKLMQFLDKRFAESKGKRGIPIEQVRRELGF